MMTDAALLIENNERIKNLLKGDGGKMSQMMAYQMASMGLNDRGKLIASMTADVRMNMNSPEALRFKTTRYGMIKLHGVKAQTYTTRNGRTVQLQAKAEQDWWNPVMNVHLPKLADKVAAIRADLVMKQSTLLNFDGRKE